MKARILCFASPRSTSSGCLHQRRHRRKMPRLWSGAFLLGRDRTRPGSARLDEPRRFSFGSGRFGESAGTIRRRGRKDSALWPKAHATELSRNLGDDNRLKAAYRGGCRACQNLPKGAIRHVERYHRHPEAVTYTGITSAPFFPALLDRRPARCAAFSALLDRL